MSFLLSLFRLFFISRCVFSLFFVFSPGFFLSICLFGWLFIGHKDEKAKWHKPATIHKQLVGFVRRMLNVLVYN